MSARAQTVLRVAASAIIAGAAVFLLGRPALRVRIDATRTRAFALSAPTRQLLASLDGEWRITVVLPDAAADDATRRQIDEVLRRLGEANRAVHTARIDPTDPAQLGAWEALVMSLQSGADDERLRAFRAALDDGDAAFTELVSFARAQAAALAALPASGDDAIDRQVASLRSGLAQLVEHGDEFVDGVRRARSTTPQQPVADDESARSLLVANHAHWSEQLDAAATALGRWGAPASAGPSATAAPPSSPNAPVALAEPVRAYATRARGAFEALAQRLATSKDRLARLPRLELAEIGRQLGVGEAAIVQGPRGVAVVPSWQLLPAAPRDEAGLRVERRFRGEQASAAASRSLLRPPPMVVLVHAEDHSLLRTAEDRNDLVGAADALRQARCDVREWLPGDSARPAPANGQPVVWIVVPPQVRHGTEISPSERLLLERARRLVDEGEPVLVTVGRSVRPLFRQDDPWSGLLAALGLRVETGRVVFEFDRIGPGRGVSRPWQRIEPRDAGHPISSALAGEAIVLTHPTPIIVDEAAAGAVVLAAIDPAPTRWIETDWRTQDRPRSAPPEGRALTAPAPVAVAIERRIDDRQAGPRPGSARPLSPRGAPGSSNGAASGGAAPSDAAHAQRAVLVGSGGWLLSSVLDENESIGGRPVATNPGNRELLLACVDWLAGRDDEIATSPTAAAATHLANIDDAARAVWGAIAIGVLPLATLAIGALVGVARRRA
ncbi:MAG: hypothetical protein U0575_05855 [Phycisphaerales bacterium]